MSLLVSLLLAATTAPTVATPAPTPATMPATPAERIAAQKAAMERLKDYDGVYVGKSTAYTPGGPVTGQVVHRIGPFLDGTIRVMEGRNYTDEGALRFNGMIVLYYNVPTAKYRVRGFANGLASETDVTMTPTGYYFDAPIEGTPGAFRRINITVTATSWEELVEVNMPGKPPTKGFEMKLRRLGPGQFPPTYPRPTER